MMATHVLSEDLPPFIQEIYREKLSVMITKKKQDLTKSGFIFKEVEETAAEYKAEEEKKIEETVPKVVTEYEVLPPMKVKSKTSPKSAMKPP
jgi:16S rRNA G966 N2-methylase RsmD